MSLDEIESTALKDLTPEEFAHVAHGIAQNSDLRLDRSEVMSDSFAALIDDAGESFLVSLNLTAGAAFKYAIVISRADNHPLGEFFTERLFLDRKRAAAGDI
jgi:hypothetical protein